MWDSVVVGGGGATDETTCQQAGPAAGGWKLPVSCPKSVAARQSSRELKSGFSRKGFKKSC